MKNFLKTKSGMVFAALFATFMWGSAFPAVKKAYEYLGIQGDMTKIFFAGIRFFVASLIVLLIILWKEKKFPNIEWKFALSLGLLHTTLQYVCYHIGLGNTTGVKASIIEALPSFLTILILHFLSKEEKINTRVAVAMIFGFAGVLISNFTKDFDWSFRFLGEGMLIISTLFSALGNVYVKLKTTKMTALEMTFSQMFVGSIFLIVLGLFVKTETLQITLQSTLLLFYCALIPAVAFALWYALLQIHSAAKISIFQLLIPVFGVFLSALFLHSENITVQTAIGLIFVVIGVSLMNGGNYEAG